VPVVTQDRPTVTVNSQWCPAAEISESCVRSTNASCMARHLVLSRVMFYPRKIIGLVRMRG